MKHITLHNAQGQYLTSMLHDRRLYYLADNLFNADPPIVHIEDITALTAKYRVYAAIGFALDHRDCTDENGEKYLKYILRHYTQREVYLLDGPGRPYRTGAKPTIKER